MKFSTTNLFAFAAIAWSSCVDAQIPPPSDECLTATNIPITDVPYSTNLSFVGYTFNPLEYFNETDCPFLGRTMWWQFTAPTDGVLSLLTADLRERFGPGLDLNIATFTSCNDIDQPRCGVNEFSATSKSYPLVRAGVTYFIEVGETEFSTGDAQYNFMARFDPRNLTVSGDECADAIVIPPSSLPFNQIVDTRLYTTFENDTITKCSGFLEEFTVFFSYTPPLSGLVIADTSGSTSDTDGGQIDTGIAIFNSCDGPVIFCDQQDFSETTYFPVTAGETYIIRVGGYYYGGQLNFTLSFQRNYFNLVNEDDEVTIGVLNDVFNGIYPGGYAGSGPYPTSTIDYANEIFVTSELSIQAIFPNQNNVESVRLQLDNQRSICEDDDDDFKIYGELNDDDVPFAFGNRVITATAYSRSNCRGNVIGSISQDFFVKGCDFLQYSLFDARRDIYVSNLYNGTSITSPPCQANVGVTFVCGFEPKKVRLELRRVSNNALVARRDEFNSPYMLFSNNGRRIQAGEYRLTAIIDNIVHQSVRFTMGTCSTPPAVDTTFDIDLRFADDRNNLYEYSKLFPPMVKRISSLIVGDKPDVTVR